MLNIFNGPSIGEILMTIGIILAVGFILFLMIAKPESRKFVITLLAIVIVCSGVVASIDLYRAYSNKSESIGSVDNKFVNEKIFDGEFVRLEKIELNESSRSGFITTTEDVTKEEYNFVTFEIYVVAINYSYSGCCSINLIDNKYSLYKFTNSNNLSVEITQIDDTSNYLMSFYDINHNYIYSLSIDCNTNNFSIYYKLNSSNISKLKISNIKVL